VVDGRRDNASVGRLPCVDVGRECPYKRIYILLEVCIFQSFCDGVKAEK